MNRRLSIIIVITVLCILGSVNADARHLIPIAAGNVWEYSVAQTGIISFGEPGYSQSLGIEAEGRSIDEVMAIKEHKPNGDVVYEHRSMLKLEAGENVDAKESMEESVMLVAKEGISVLASKSTSRDEDSKWVNYNPPLMMLIADLEPGKRWEVGTVRDGELHMRMEARVDAIESVRVPAGIFENCIRIYITCPQVKGYVGSGKERAKIHSGRSITTLWVAPGVGVVREDTLLQATMQFTSDGQPVKMTGTQREIKELLPGYHVTSVQ